MSVIGQSIRLARNRERLHNLMTTATATPQPPGPPPVEGATWNGAEWYLWDGANWNKVPAATTPPAPPPPPEPEKPTEPLPVPSSFKEFFDQPSSVGGEGRYWKYHQKPVGTSYWGIVKRAVVLTDIKPQTDAEGNVQRQNGQVRWQLEVPMLMMPDQDFQDGFAVVVFKSDARDKLNAEMVAVGVEPHPDGGYLPEAGAFIQMTKSGEQTGTSKKGGFTKYIYEVVYRRPDDPWSVAKRAEVNAAHKALAEEGPPPPPPEMVYNHATKQWELKTPAAAPAPPPPPPPAAAAPAVPPPAASTPAVPPPAAPAASSPGAEALQAAAAHVATADANGQPAPTPPPPAPAVPPPATNGATSNGAAAGAPAVAPQITRQQWELMPPQIRAIISAQTGQPIPADLAVPA
jgi:hypothetical protein